MKVEVEELGACKRRLQVEETPEVVRAAWEEAFSRVQKQAKLPGFRKGKVPRSMIKIHFADDVRQEVARHLIPDVYRQALAETQIKPVEDPDLQEVRLEEDAPLVFSAVVEIKPDIALGAYTGLAVSHTPAPLTDEEVEEAIEQIREQHAEYRAVERAADIGDLVIVDYTLTPEDMEPRSESGYGFVIGQSQVHEGDRRGGDRPGARRDARDAAALRRRPPERGAARQVRRRHRDAARGEGEDPARARRRVRQDRGRLRDARRAARRGPQGARGPARARQPPGPRGEDRRGPPRGARVPGARRAGDAPGRPHRRARAGAVRRQGVDPDKLPWDYQKLLAELRPGAEKAVRRTLLLEAIAEKESLARRRRRRRRGREDRPGEPAAGPGGAEHDGAERRPGRPAVLAARAADHGFPDRAGPGRPPELHYHRHEARRRPMGLVPMVVEQTPAASGRSTSSPGSSRSGSSSSRPHRGRDREPGHRADAVPRGRGPGQGHQPVHQLAGRVGHRGDGDLRHDAVRQAGRVDDLHGAGGVDGRDAPDRGREGKRFALPHARS